MPNQRPGRRKVLPDGRSPSSGPRRSRRLIPVLVFAAAGLLIAFNELTPLASWFEKSFYPKHWQARQICREAALNESMRPSTLRVLNEGRVEATEAGLVLSGMLLGEMGEDGGESRSEFTCYVDNAGQMTGTGRKLYVAPPTEDNPGDRFQDR